MIRQLDETLLSQLRYAGLQDARACMYRPGAAVSVLLGYDSAEERSFADRHHEAIIAAYDEGFRHGENEQRIAPVDL